MFSPIRRSSLYLALWRLDIRISSLRPEPAPPKVAAQSQRRRSRQPVIAPRPPASRRRGRRGVCLRGPAESSLGLADRDGEADGVGGALLILGSFRPLTAAPHGRRGFESPR